MATYLLTWKPTRWDWTTLESEVRELNEKGRLGIRWSAGVNRHIMKGDRVFLLRQGADRPGIIGSGYVTRGSYLAPHWDQERNGRAVFVDVRMDALLHPEQDRILPREALNFGPPRLWISQASGTTIPPNDAAQLERRWAAHLKKAKRAPVALAAELLNATAFPEGAKQRIIVNRYERDPRNRAACLAIHGYKCSACGFDFGRTYGEIGRNFIHVHHVFGLARSMGTSRRINPRYHLQPVCPNCHEMLHIGGALRTIEELRRIIRANRRRL